MKKCWVIIPLILWVLLSAAQTTAETIQINGKITGQMDTMPKTVRLSYYRAYSLITKDIDVDSTGAFKYTTAISEPSVLSIVFAGLYFNIVISPTEKTYNVNTVLRNNVPVKLEVPGSAENAAYTLFTTTTDNYLLQVDSFMQTKQNEDAITGQVNAFNKKMQNIASAHKGTFAADILTRAFLLTAPVKKTGVDYFRNQFINKEAYNNPAFYNSTYPADIFALYSKYFLNNTTKETSAWYADFVGSVTDSICLNRLHETLYNTLYSRQMEKELSVYADWVNATPGVINNLYVKYQLSVLAKILCGKKAPDIVEANAVGETVTLQRTAAKNKTTLLVIWSATCSHCQQEIPLLKPVYEKYRKQGFEIFSVAVNSTEAEWKEFSEKNGIGWQNTFHANTSSYGSLTDYMITSIPAFILVDQNGIIIKRYVKREQIEDFIK